jgi:hypothetical protein
MEPTAPELSRVRRGSSAGRWTEPLSMDTPDSMKAELAAWNNGAGIDLGSWVGCEGSFGMAVGYAAVFWPEFVEFEGLILRAGFSLEALRGFQQQEGIDRAGVEAVMNHRHIADIQYYGCPDASADKLLHLGTVLAQVYEAKLRWQFPTRPCRVSLVVPPDSTDLMAYEVTFWQQAHEGLPV